MRNISLTVSAPVYEGDADIEFIQVTEDMEAFFIPKRYFPGAGTADWPSTEPIVIWGQPYCQAAEINIVRRESGQPHNWISPRPPRLQEVDEAPNSSQHNSPHV